MTPNEQALATFQARVRQMILQFNKLKQENDELYNMVDKNERDIEELRRLFDDKEKDYDSLKMAKILAVADGDLDNTRARLSKLIRDVNKCIAVLKEQK